MTVLVPMEIDEKKLTAKVRRAERMLRPDVVRIRHEFIEDWTGSPMLEFRVVVTDRAAWKGIGETVTGKTRQVVEKVVQPRDLPMLHYFRFRTESEQADLQEPAWD
jgi:hypothetical protein